MVNKSKKQSAAPLTPGRALPVAGVDGCPAGWIAVVWPPGTERLETFVSADWAAAARRLTAAATVCVDIPIGLSETGARDCDAAARRLLRSVRKSASVFPAPRRYQLGLDWATANARGKAREGKGLSRQSANIMPKIAQLDTALAPGDQDRVLETHPELAFHRLNAWAPLPPKRRSEGRRARLALLHAAGLPDPESLLNRHPRRDAAVDDVLDAAVCALVAYDALAGHARRIPEANPPRDGRGLRMEIWY